MGLRVPPTSVVTNVTEVMAPGSPVNLIIKNLPGVPQLQHPCRNSAAVIISASAQVPELVMTRASL
jgi:hypothetical protein